MSYSKKFLLSSLQANLPNELVEKLLNEYSHIKQQFLLKKWRPTELECGRFCECVLRIIEYCDRGHYTPFGVQAKSEQIIKNAENNVNLNDSIRFLIPRLVRVVLDFRNKRDIAHVGGEVSPNEQDSLLVVHSSDWIMAEIVRKFHSVTISEASKIVKSILELKIPIINEFDGFLKILNTKLDARQKTLVLIYYKQPDSVSDSDLFKWSGYGQFGNYKLRILKVLNEESFIHYANNKCFLTNKGIIYVENHITIEEILI